jgi:hypothetical protein
LRYYIVSYSLSKEQLGMAIRTVRLDEETEKPRSWNIWLTLMVIAVAFSIVVAVLEYVGVWRDLAAS